MTELATLMHTSATSTTDALFRRDTATSQHDGNGPVKKLHYDSASRSLLAFPKQRLGVRSLPPTPPEPRPPRNSGGRPKKSNPLQCRTGTFLILTALGLTMNVHERH